MHRNGTDSTIHPVSVWQKPRCVMNRANRFILPSIDLGWSISGSKLPMITKKISVGCVLNPILNKKPIIICIAQLKIITYFIIYLILFLRTLVCMLIVKQATVLVKSIWVVFWNKMTIFKIYKNLSGPILLFYQII